ncbi:membrane protein, partial [Candidatus Thiomargarita nelsonii]
MLIELFLLSSASAYWLTSKQNKYRPNQALADTVQPSHTKRFSPKQLFKDVKSALRSDERQQQLGTSIDLSKEMQKAQQNVNRELLVSIGAVTTALLGGVSPLFMVLGAMGVLYLSRDYFRFIWHDIKAGRILTRFLIYGIVILGMILSGHLLLAAMASLIGGFFVMIIEKTEDHSKKQL